MLYMMEWALKSDSYDKAHNRFLDPDFRFRCGTVTHRISSRALIARVPTQEPRDGG